MSILLSEPNDSIASSTQIENSSVIWLRNKTRAFRFTTGHANMHAWPYCAHINGQKAINYSHTHTTSTTWQVNKEKQKEEALCKHGRARKVQHAQPYLLCTLDLCSPAHTAHHVQAKTIVHVSKPSAQHAPK